MRQAVLCALLALTLTGSALAGPYNGPWRDPWTGDLICALIVDESNHIYIDAADAPLVAARRAITSFTLIPQGWGFALPADLPAGASATPNQIVYSNALGFEGAWDLGTIAPEGQYDVVRNFLGGFATMTYTTYGSATPRTFEYAFPFPEPSTLSILAMGAMLILRRHR